MTQLINELQDYIPYNQQEKNDKELIIEAIKKNENIFSRKNKTYHITVSAWIVNETFTKILMAYHNIYKSWSWLGGHADEKTDLKAVILKEVNEESGLKNVTFLSNKIFSLEVLSVDGHIKNGQYVSSHLHLNITYLLQANENEQLFIKEDENQAINWFKLENSMNISNEKWFNENIYNKLNRKLELWIKQM